MGRETNISWTDSTWNAIRGCSRVSEGCRHCYAESIAHRFSGPGLAYEGLVQLDASGKSTGKWNGQIKFLEAHLLDPLKWKEPRRIFVNSMSDLFHENVTDEMRDKIFAVMALCPQHTFQVLTKRPERMLAYLSDDNPRYTIRRIFDAAEKIDAENGYVFDCDIYKPLSNVHLGVSVEDQKTADLRIPLLLQTPAAVRFISAEPLLGPVNLGALKLDGPNAWTTHECKLDGLSVRSNGSPALGWVIVGGESGAGARPMHPDWARSLRDQCKAAGVPYFFKQWGAWTPGENVDRVTGTVDTAVWFNNEWLIGMETLSNDEGHVDDQPDLYRVGTKAAGCLLDSVEHHEFPAVPA
jgi:protein gp37